MESSYHFYFFLNKLTFGEYEWRILDIKEDKNLILKEEVIDLPDYHNKSVDITWKDCDLRRFLNSEFYDSLVKMIVNHSSCTFVGFLVSGSADES